VKALKRFEDYLHFFKWDYALLLPTLHIYDSLFQDSFNGQSRSIKDIKKLKNENLSREYFRNIIDFINLD